MGVSTLISTVSGAAYSVRVENIFPIRQKSTGLVYLVLPTKVNTAANLEIFQKHPRATGTALLSSRFVQIESQL